MPKYNVNFSDNAYQTLATLSEELGMTMAEVVREALSTYWWLARELEHGHRVVIDRNGTLTQVVFPSFEAAAQAKRRQDRTPVSSTPATASRRTPAAPKAASSTGQTRDETDLRRSPGGQVGFRPSR